MDEKPGVYGQLPLYGQGAPPGGQPLYPQAGQPPMYPQAGQPPMYPQAGQPPIYPQNAQAPLYPQSGRPPTYSQGNPVESGKPPTGGPLLGVGGLPYASPYFGGAEDEIRRGFDCCWCLEYPPGPAVPPHWYDGGRGWVSRYFTDVVPFDSSKRANGRFRCQVPVGQGTQCSYEVAGEGCCEGNMCWCPTGEATGKMVSHLTTNHNVQPPAPRKWQSDLCDGEGCWDTWCCVTCQGSRQMMALAGHPDKFNLCWCILFCLLGCRTNDGRNWYYVPPWIFIACFTRPRMLTLNNIDEECCTTCLIMCCCAPCSIAQTYRELTKSGVWPGSTCCNSPPTSSAPPQMA